MADDYRAKKAYELLEKKRLANVARNQAEGRTGIISGVDAYDTQNRSESLSQAMEDLRAKGKTTNLENTIKKTSTDTIGINPEVRNKSRFFNLDKKLGVVDDIADTLKSNKGFGKVLPMLGLGGLGLAASSIYNKVNAGELGSAGLEAADVATDYIPVVGTLKDAIRPTELESSELPDELMKEREIYNAARRGKMNEPVNNPSLEQPLLAPEDRVKKKDLDAVLSNILTRKK